MSDILNKIKVALAGCGRGDFANFADAAKDLLKVLGYESDRTPENMSDAVADFVDEYDAPTPGLKSERDFLENAVNVKLLFQFTDEEIAESKQRGLGLESLQEFNAGDNRSFYFVAADLKPKHYSRSDYARFVREINKRFNSPAVTLFRRPASDDAPASLTLGFVGRRPNMLQAERDVLEKVSLLREIQCEEPHRGHLDILDELSLDKRFNWIKSEKKSRNFDGLLAAWLDELDAEALNRRFYKALYRWFEWARAKAVFPCPPKAQRDKDERAKAAADSVIRLITRMMFIWFIKEKKLVSDKLFYEEEVAPLLADYDAAKGDTYYRAILQNLFFATLNTEIRHREFNPEGQPGHRSGHGYRYKTLMANPKKIRALMNQTPFINGGLFDCLDSEEAGDFRADMFSDPDPKKWATARRKAFAALSVPNFLFFQDKKDLKAQRGLLTIFKKYKFTVEENTPVEQEVALDPELLGKVFENLLAEVNPETRESARNQTGSFYTPRAVVDYMTDESLVAYLSAKVPGNPGDGQWRQKLRDLFDYAKNECENIAKNKIAPLVGAIADIKVLDPACGSGAFPMGVLNKLALALSKLDPKNREWKKFQEKRATAEAGKTFASVQSQAKRDKRLEEINETFTHYSDTFGRKLFLIQNSIFGVDIQPIACQIAKLRFFISLAIEQEKKEGKKNYGIRPLPNLETRFVAADTLVRIHGMKEQGVLGDEKIEQLRGEITDSRERHFNARTRNAKEKCRKEDKRLRGLLADALQANGFATAPAAHKISNWDLYNQNAFAEWFDSKWMFGLSDGFDVVIGNPPYILIRSLALSYKENLRGQNFASFHGTGDMYMLFYEKGLSLSKDGGTLSFITSNTWMRSDSGAKLRRALTENSPRYLINMGDGVFDNVTVSTNILLIHKGKQDGVLNAADLNRVSVFPPTEWTPIAPKGEDNWVIESPQENSIAEKIRAAGIPISQWNSKIHVGIFTGYNPAFVIDLSVKKRLCSADSASAKIIFPVLYGKDIRQYAYHQEQWVIVIPQGWTNQNRGQRPPEEFFRNTYPAVYDHLLSFADVPAKGKGLIDRDNVGDYWWELRPCAYYSEFAKPKLVWSDIASKGQFAYDEKNMYLLSGAYAMTGDGLKYLLAVLNSSLINHQMRRVAVNLGNEGLRWRKSYVEKLCIPRISKAEQRPFVALAEKITAAKAANPTADTSKMEDDIDELVYELYGLTKGEIAIIESSAP